jgi:hypothetical protein
MADHQTGRQVTTDSLHLHPLSPHPLLRRGSHHDQIRTSERKAAVVLSAIKAAGSILRQNDKPKEALLKEIASELRGRLAEDKSSQPSG